MEEWDAWTAGNLAGREAQVRGSMDDRAATLRAHVRMPKLKAGWWSPEEEQSLLDGHAKHTAAGSLSLWADILGDTSLFFAIGTFGAMLHSELDSCQHHFFYPITHN